MIRKWFSLTTNATRCPEIMLSFNGSDGSSIKTRLASMRCMGGCGVLNMRPPSDSKSPRPVSRRGLDYCDDVNMPVICPTRQDLFCKSFLQALFARAF